MAKKLSAALGVDIGSSTIKIAEVRTQGKEPVVTAVGMIATPEGAVDHTGIYNPEAVAAAVKQVVAQAGATVGQVVVSIQGQSSVLVRTLEVPRANPTELKEHMEWEFNRNNPFAEANPMKDFKALPDENPSSPNMDVVMAIAAPSAVETVVQCVRKGGKAIAAIDVEPMAMARLLAANYADDFRGETVCVINVGHKTTAINIFKDSKLLMPRQVPVGGENFTRAVADAMALTMPEAEERKREKANIANLASAPATMSNPFGPVGGATQGFAAYNPFADNPMDAPPAAAGDEPAAPEAEPDATPAVVATDGMTDRVSNAMANELDEFVAEIRRSIDYFRSRGGDVNRLVLTGGGSKIGGMSEFLSKSLAMPCDSLDPLRRLNTSIKKMEPEFLENHRAELAVAVGNGLQFLFD